ncbi:unnamed protein product [marine sediment metagenome]|uniref:Outer membrane protein beta-barrel domain-containing protein n=1 Tax=marine sediment metagenome TaxID=412755 RepID=X0TUS8_9ZZZZ
MSSRAEFSHTLSGEWTMIRWLLTIAVCVPFACPAFAFEREDHEEEAGESFAFLLNTEDDIYGISMGSGTWLKGSPVFGDYFLSLFSNRIEDAFYSAVGMTIRLMPHWTVAPFAGGGGSYNFSWASEPSDDDELPDRGASYWGAHVEAGVRVWSGGKVGLVELMGRYTWSSLSGDRDYWLIGLSTRPGI